MASTIDIELGCAKDESSSRSRDTQSNRSRRQSIFLYGKETFLDAAAEKRILWAQRGIGVFSFFALFFYIITNFAKGRSSRNIIRTLTTLFGSFALACAGCLYYKNISFVLIKRLLKEPNVVILLVLTLCNWAIDIGKPAIAFSPVMGFMYVLVTCAFVFFDAVIIKSRYMVLGVGVLFFISNVYLLYSSTLGKSNIGTVLLKYTFDGTEHTIMKRSTKRSIYLQILLFSANGIYTMFKDKSMKLMLFATGHIYRNTGTASGEIHDERFSFKLNRERKERKRETN